jgi:hypothetical protein
MHHFKLRPQHAGFVMLVFACVVGSPAHADRIDGEWCHTSGSLVIEGPKIRTPGGSKIEGTYSRHDFSYQVPTAEPDAGAQINMQLLGEETMTLTRPNRPSETWKRCKVTS